ncbi:MAG: tripartite tricarboxylate transporter substrate binding protein [Betaproteobacteria bacterium]|nr:tripartite tricarboxylate transporter substrate binding protein [Betaproteobacteria bacterium]
MSSLISSRTIAFATAALSAFAAGLAFAQDKYPSRPIEFIVPWGPGGGADQVARKASQLMEKELKVSLPVINVAGATGQTGLTKMLTSAADGYSISIMTGDTFGLLTDPTTKWKLDDVVPAAIMIRQPSAFFTAENSNLKSWAEVEREARNRQLKVAITGFGSPDDMHVQYFVAKGLKLIAVPFPKPAERYTAILGGHADILYEQLGDVKSFLDGKQMRPVILFADSRFPLFKDVPTGKELKHDIIINQFRAVVVKAGTDPARVKLISDALAKVAASDDYKAYLKDQYADEASFIPAGGALAFMKKELESMRRFAPKK